MSPNIKTNITIISIFAGTFLLPLATSFLLDLEIINNSIVRKLIIYLLIITEMAAGVIVLKAEIQK